MRREEAAMAVVKKAKVSSETIETLNVNPGVGCAQVNKARYEAMREALPGLTIDHKQGGFLGVTCLDTLDACQISGIVAGGAAEAAGLIEVNRDLAAGQRA